MPFFLQQEAEQALEVTKSIHTIDCSVGSISIVTMPQNESVVPAWS